MKQGHLKKKKKKCIQAISFIVPFSSREQLLIFQSAGFLDIRVPQDWRKGVLETSNNIFI